MLPNSSIQRDISGAAQRFTIDNFIASMTRGLGSLQRHILTALQQHGGDDTYCADSLMHLTGERRQLRARWRWYATEMIGLVDESSTETKRATANHAIRALARRGQLQVWMGDYPYQAPFTSYQDENGEHVSAVDLAELHAIDSHWPQRHGRRLWFRLPPPPRRAIPVNDQIAVLHHLDKHRPEEFEDFAATVDRHHAWNSPIGQLLTWMLCGNTLSSTDTQSRSDGAGGDARRRLKSELWAGHAPPSTHYQFDHQRSLQHSPAGKGGRNMQKSNMEHYRYGASDRQ